MSIKSLNNTEEKNFILDAGALIEAFPEPENMKITLNDSKYLYIHHRDMRENANMCFIEISKESNYIELRDIAIREDKRGQGFGKKVITELIRQCRDNKLNLFSDLCNQSSIAVIRSSVKELEIDDKYEEYDLEEDGEFRFLIRFETA